MSQLGMLCRTRTFSDGVFDLYSSRLSSVVRSSCALLERAVEDPVHPNPLDSSPAEDRDWYVTSPQQHRSNRWGVQPIKDYSTGKSEGHFLLLKPTSTHFAAGRCSFHMTSPVVLSSGPLCHLRLARFQPEPHTGNISAFVKHTDHSIIKPIALTVKEQGTGRSQWEVLEAVIGQLDEPFQVTVQYSSCSSHEVGFLAFDSLELKDCVMGDDYFDLGSDCEKYSSLHCHSGGCIEKRRVCDFHTDCPQGEDEGLVCNDLPLGSYCSFELGSCGWSLADSQSSWRLISGQQLTEDTDLLGTTLQNTQGHFLFLKFSMYLYGDFNGTVLLSVVEKGMSASPLIWERSGHWKDAWQEITLPITEILKGFHLKVQAFWASGSKADIALDDISLSAACFDTDPLSSPHCINPVDRISLDQQICPYWSTMCWFSGCLTASGPLGPTQAQCDSAYRNSNVSVVVGKEGPLRGVQMWRVPATNMYKISAYGAAGGKGAKNHNKRSHGVIISAIFPLEKGDTLYILIGHQGEDACPGRNPLTHKICLGESSVIEDGFDSDGSALKWAGGGGGGGGATYIYRMENGEPVPLLIAAGGGGKAYLEDPESSLDQIFLEQYENDTSALGVNGKSGAAGGGGGWSDLSSLHWAGKSLVEGGQGGSSCPEALTVLGWATFGGFGGGGGACTAGGGGGGYRGGDAPLLDGITADGQDGVSFVHPMGKIFLQPLAAMESHGEAEIEVYLNCSHCQTQSCKRDEDTRLILCLCDSDEVLAPDNVTCLVVPLGSLAEGPPSLIFILAVIASTVVTGVVLTCASLTLSKRLFQFCVNSVPSTFHQLRWTLIVCLPLSSPPCRLVVFARVSPSLTPNTWSTSCRLRFAPLRQQPDGKRGPLTSTQRPPQQTTNLHRGHGQPPLRNSMGRNKCTWLFCFFEKITITLKAFYYRKKNHLHAVRIRLQSPEYKLSKIRSSTIMTDYNPNYCFAGKAASLSELKEVLGMNGENTAMQVAIKTLPEICSEQDEMDFLMEALIMSKFSHQNIVRCIGVSLQILPRFILLELMTGGDMKTFLRLNRPRTLLHMARDIALGCRYLEENHFIHRDIAARNCLLTCPGPERVAKIGDFGMARDIYRASYYRKGGRAMLPVKWMPPEAFLEGIFTCKTDTWSFGVLLWEIFSLGYMPYPCKTNQEVLEFVTGGGRMDPPKSCPGPV
ncbi:ALK tyrosine kinase receptor [Labeo rohita]|uniref:receptor protein-tyrosine kinase n=1 Tax=Labeo rohita TaxID=84645 RepID=A0ABQ8LUY5_LABRO|nr:ALK tyrosine kinase receptor [Labeo rohita]